MRCLVTGAAGFIGSHLCDALLALGHEVVGVDAFIPYYPRSIKERNLAAARRQARFSFDEQDLREEVPPGLLKDIDVIFHLAGMPGLLLSWVDFDLYTSCNLQATHRLLEALRTPNHVQQFIYASTSSVYGRNVVGPETTKSQPVSPYGITKLASEQLIQAYAQEFGLPTTILRYFSVYGPRQRPDMGYYKFIEGVLHDRKITICGDGNQLRGSTHVADIVRATILAHQHFEAGQIYNIGGTQEISANQTIQLLEKIMGRQASVEYGPARPGEQQRTLADTRNAQERLGFVPLVSFDEGLITQIEWQTGELS